MLQAEERSRWFKLGRQAAIAIALGASAFASGVALAQSDFPEQAHSLRRWICPRRSVRHHLASDRRQDGRELGQQVVVENRTGGGGMVATDYVARSDPDGYTMLNTTTANAATSRFRRACRRGSARTSPRSRRLPTPRTSSSCIRRSA